MSLIALMALAGFCSVAHADEGAVSLTIYKAGWIIGGSGGGGTLTFRGRRYGLSAGGLDYGLVFGGSKTELHGRVSHINQPSDIAGVYGAAGAAGGRRRGACDRADQSEGRGAGIGWPGGRADGQCGSQRSGDLAEIIKAR